MKQTFDLASVMERFHLDTTSVENALFPNVLYKNRSLNRVLKGESFLDTNQIIALAELAGVLVHELFEVGCGWKGSVENDTIVLTKGKYSARLNYNGAALTIYKNNACIETILTLQNDMQITGLINLVNSKIKSFENGTN